MTNKRRCFVLALRLAPALLLAAPAGAAAAALKIGIFSETLPGGDATLPARLAESFRNGLGGEVALLDGAAACDGRAHAALSLYVIPNARSYPAQGFAPLAAYLERGGKLLLLGGPPFQNPVWRLRGGWIDRAGIVAELQTIAAARVVLDFEDEAALRTWTRATNDPALPARLAREAGAPGGKGNCLAVSMERLSGWFTCGSPALPRMFAEGHELLCLWARGDGRTPQLAIELNEEDGSRWIATITLEPAWKRFTLSPEDFHYWFDSPTAGSRGSAGDRCDPARVARIVLGVSASHTPRVDGGPHKFWVAEVGTAPNPFAGLTFETGALPPIESVWPPYKLYGDAPQAPSGIAKTFRPFARPAGKGFGADAKWRLMRYPLASSRAAEDGAVPAWALYHHAPPYKGAVIACVGINDPEAWSPAAFDAGLRETVAGLARFLSRECRFLREAGAEAFAYRPGEPVALGAEVVNAGALEKDVQVRFTVSPPDGAAAVFSAEIAAVAAAGTRAVVRPPRPVENLGEGRYAVKVELRSRAAVLDAIEHAIVVLPRAAPAAEEYVTVAGGDFRLRGKKWYPVGVNFWPRYVAGLDTRDYGTGWLTRGYYDPDAVEDDLALVAALGMNMVAIQLPGVAHIRNVLDFLDRCGRRDIKVFAYLGAASPLGFDERAVRAIVAAGNLADNTALFAYDTIWEPGNWVFGSTQRQRWDRDWENWIVERYGSIEAAERDWGREVPRRGEAVAAPSDRELGSDGPWRIMVAAYRRFMDDRMSRAWNDATRALRACDPRHLVSFRQGNTLPHDFTLTATVKHIDFICPEGYSIPPGRDGEDAAGFITRYVAFTTGGKPILWAEFGQSVWDRDAMRPDEAAIARQAEYHEIFYRTVLAAGAHGTAPWWWPGGYRVDERSDFGICNPDGTPRPAALHAAAYAPRLKTPRAARTPDTWIVVDRDAHAGGYWRLAFHEGKAAYAEAAARGLLLGVKTAGTGATSANAPPLAAGNTPLNGRNPPKYLNGEFNRVEIQDRSGAWVAVPRGGRIEVAAAKPVALRVSAGNTQEAEWLPPAEAGARGGVFLAAGHGSEIAVRRPLPARTPYLADADFGEFVLAESLAGPARVALQLEAEGISRFGEIREFTLAPMP